MADNAQNLQAEADRIYERHGRVAPGPEPGESVARYDARLVRGVQQHSETFGKVDYSSLPEAARAPIRQRIFEDAQRAADNPKTAPGELREVKRRDQSGRVISTFVGDPNGWLGQFKLEKQLARINDPRK